MKKTLKRKIKKWKNVKPHSKKSRRRVKNKYGSKCFLDSKRLKYPICNKFNGKIECKGLNAANYYVNLNISRKLKPKYKYKNLSRKIKKLKLKNNCN